MNLLRYFLNFAFSCPAAAFGMGALNKHTYSKDELFQETEQHRRLGGIRHRFGSLPAHNGTDRQFVGLHGIYRHILQTRSGPPSRSASFHDSGTNIHAVLFRKSGKRGHDGQCHVEYSQRIHDSVPVLDHNASGTQDFRARFRFAHKSADMDGHRSGHYRSGGIHIYRHVLVLGNRRRGLRPVLHVHRPRGMGHAQMGGCSRPAACKPLVGADNIPNGPVDRRTHPQPADNTGARLHILFQKDGQSHFLGRRQGHSSGMRHTAVHQLAGAVHRRHRRMVRPHVRKRARAAGEQRSDTVHAAHIRRSRVGRLVHPHEGTRAAEHNRPLRHHYSSGLHLVRLDSHTRIGEPSDEQQRPPTPPTHCCRCSTATSTAQGLSSTAAHIRPFR